MSTQPKVNIIAPTVPTLSNYYSHVIRSLQEAGVEVRNFAPPPGNAWEGDSAEPAVTYTKLRFQRGRITPATILASFVQALQLGRAAPQDIFVLIGFQAHVLYGLPLRVMNRRCIYVVSGRGTVFSSRLPRFCFARSIALRIYRFLCSSRRSRIVVQNSDDFRFVIEQFRADVGSTYQMPGCGVDPERFPLAGASSCSSRPIILVPARLVRDKGIYEAAAASEILTRKGIAHEMWFTSGPDLGSPDPIKVTDLERLSAANPSLRFLGWQPEMAPLYHACDVVCLPTYAEGLPSALLEASACGRAVVATNVRGCREVVIHGHTGLLVEPRSASALAAALATLVRDPVLRERLRINAYQRFVDKFTKVQSAAAIMPAFRSLGIRAV